MRVGRRAVTVVGTFFLAAATGHVMQNAEELAGRLQGAASSELTQASLTSAQGDAQTSAVSLPEPDLSARLPEFPDLPVLEPVHLTDGVMLAARVDGDQTDYDPALGAVMTEYDTYGQACAAPTINLVRLKPAMIGLSVSAPCHGHEEITVSHAGLSYAATTDGGGGHSATVPALAASGEVIVRFESGAQLDARIVVPDLGSVKRYALVMRGTTRLSLNAFIKGAAFNTAGHLRVGNEGLPTLGLGGFLTSLGDPGLAFPRQAHVFTAPANGSNARVVLMAAIQPDSCGRDLMAMLFSAERSVVPVAGAVTFAMPDCEAIGDSLAYEVDGAAFATLAQSGD